MNQFPGASALKNPNWSPVMVVAHLDRQVSPNPNAAKPPLGSSSQGCACVPRSKKPGGESAIAPRRERKPERGNLVSQNQDPWCALHAYIWLWSSKSPLLRSREGSRPMRQWTPGSCAARDFEVGGRLRARKIAFALPDISIRQAASPVPCPREGALPDMHDFRCAPIRQFTVRQGWRGVLSVDWMLVEISSAWRWGWVHKVLGSS